MFSESGFKSRVMEYPKKFTKSYSYVEDIPAKIIRGDGIKIVEYRRVKIIGQMGVFKRE
jgi:hypothetical protein